MCNTGPQISHVELRLISRESVALIVLWLDDARVWVAVGCSVLHQDSKCGRSCAR